jgi:hypothetical protein
VRINQKKRTVSDSKTQINQKKRTVSDSKTQISQKKRTVSDSKNTKTSKKRNLPYEFDCPLRSGNTLRARRRARGICPDGIGIRVGRFAQTQFWPSNALRKIRIELKRTVSWKKAEKGGQRSFKENKIPIVHLAAP